MNYLKKCSCAILMLFYFASIGFAANKVITKKFDWQICPTEHFDVYFYDEGKNIMPWFTAMIEEAYKDNTNGLNVEITERTPVFLYIGHNDFEETNVTSAGEGTGGVTEAFKNRLMLPHVGSKFWLDYVFRHEFTHVIQFNVLFGGFWKSARLIKFIIYPNWLMEGLAEFETKERQAVERDMYLRDAVISGTLLSLKHLNNFSHLKPHQVTLAYKESNGLMNFIAEEYGKDKITEMLNLFREKFDYYSVLSETIGLGLDDLERKYFEYLEDLYPVGGLNEPGTYGIKVTTSTDIYWEFNTNPVLLSGNRMLYITDRNGYEEIVVTDITTKKTKTVIGHNDFDTVENISRSGRGISLTENERYMVFVGEKEQKDYIYVYDFKNEQLKRLDTGFDIINSADISSDGRKIFFIAMLSAHTDIYACNTEGKNVEKIYDTFDDVSDVTTSNDSRFIIFSKEEKALSKDSQYQRDLYMLDLYDDSIKQITDFEGNEYSPCISPDSRQVIFAADKDGISNLYTCNIDSGQITKQTNVVGGNFTPCYSKDGTKIAFSSYRRGQKHIYLSNVSELENKNIIYSGKSQESAFVTKQKPLVFSPYRFSPSTDLIFPVFYYSSIDGFLAAAYWQVSDMTGDNSLLVNTQFASGIEYADYQLQYNFLKYRPQFFAALQGTNRLYKFVDQDFNVVQTIRQSRQDQVLGMTYPLNRHDEVGFTLQNSIINEKFEDITTSLSDTARSHEHSVLLSFLRDTVTGKYIEANEGSRIFLSEQFGTDVFGGDYIYQDSAVQLHKFVPLGLQYALGNRLLWAKSAGRDKHSFSLFGLDRVRMSPAQTGYEEQSVYNGNNNLLIYNFEWRFPIVYDINYYTFFIFPDFFFKSFYGTYFIDVGKGWDDGKYEETDTVYAYGLGLRLDTFILQQYYLPINLYLSFSPINYKYESFFTFGIVF